MAPASTPDTLIRDADIALYTAKERGRNGYELFDPAAPRRPDPLTTAEALRGPCCAKSCACTISPRSTSSPEPSPEPRRWCAGSTLSAG